MIHVIPLLLYSVRLPDKVLPVAEQDFFSDELSEVTGKSSFSLYFDISTTNVMKGN